LENQKGDCVQLTPRQRFLNALQRSEVDRAPVANPNSIVTVELQEKAQAYFPEAHYKPEIMAKLAAAGHTICGYDVVFPVFGAGTQEAAALGVPIEWGNMNNLPAVAGHIWKDVDDINIPDDFLEKQPIKTVLEAIRLLKEEFGDRVGIVGKIYGPWSLAFHTFGISEFLLDTVMDPQKVKAILHRLKEIPLIFAKAQIEAGADALNVCDHITGDLVSPEAYPQFLLEIHQEFSQKIPCPLILHCCGKTLDRIEYFNQSGMACYNFESANDAKKMRAKSNMVLLGNINNIQTILQGSKKDVKKEVFYALDAGIEIIGPECAVPVNGKLSNIIAVREAVEEYFQK
jgi:[methyl-Co(III) methanol-specific corrinoid protein]:coenzyme M methyltransferase